MIGPSQSIFLCLLIILNPGTELSRRHRMTYVCGCDINVAIVLTGAATSIFAGSSFLGCHTKLDVIPHAELIKVVDIALSRQVALVPSSLLAYCASHP